ncbi:hypothetical protein PIB30_058508 [Stylosanthes scabra]|uniref:Uncharacterized protein n=1 Tax=Stylosanthes scabra TaxID=79078 RepID=A0ABU6VJK2_9FABA|nr:hypothetical protein [Stylosanthes scabra]
MEETDFLEYCESIKFAKEMASAFSFFSLQSALDTANDVWFNKLNVHSWLITLNANINICEKLPLTYASHTNASRTDTYSILKGNDDHVREVLETPRGREMEQNVDELLFHYDDDINGATMQNVGNNALITMSPAIDNGQEGGFGLAELFEQGIENGPINSRNHEFNGDGSS